MTRSDAPEAPNDLRAALRQRTAAAHRSLDGLPQQRALVRPGLSLAEYAEILAGHARAQQRCEARMARVAAACPADLAPYRSRLPALRSDLARLPVGRAVAEASVAPDAPDAPDVLDVVDASDAEGRYLGLRYVLDGATQGARWIAPRLAETLPEVAAGPFAFWRLQQDEARAWHEVTRVLAARPAEGRLANAAIASACEAFDTFLEAFDAVQDASARRPGRTGGAGAEHGEGAT